MALVVTSGQTTGSSVVTQKFTAITADVALTTNVFADGPSLSLEAGTWLLWAVATFLNGTNGGTANAKLWDGTTVYASSESAITASSRGSLALVAAVSPLATTTYKLSVTFNTALCTLKATPTTNATGETNTGTSLAALRTA